MVSAIRRNAVWTTNNRGDGWLLWAHPDNGGWQPVNGQDGQQLGFRFADIAAGAHAASAGTLNRPALSVAMPNN
jgi:hypothetical protein